MKEDIIELQEMGYKSDLLEALNLVKLIHEGVQIDRFLLKNSPKAEANELHYAAAIQFCEKLKCELVIESANSKQPGYPQQIKNIITLLKKPMPRNLNELGVYLNRVFEETKNLCFAEIEPEANKNKKDSHMCKFF